MSDECKTLAQRLRSTAVCAASRECSVCSALRVAADRIEALQRTLGGIVEFMGEDAVENVQKACDGIDAMVAFIAKLPTYADPSGPMAGKPFVPGRDDAFSMWRGKPYAIESAAFQAEQWWFWWDFTTDSATEAYSTAEAAAEAAKGAPDATH